MTLRPSVAINAQLTPDIGMGGIVSVLTSLVSSLGRLDDGPEEYVIVGPWNQTDWLQPYLGPNQRLVRGPEPVVRGDKPRGAAALRAKARRILAGGPSHGDETVAQRAWSGVPVSNGFFESLGCGVIHFPYQDFTICALPTVYNPHDLQHRHLPQFFDTQTLLWRETVYPAGCHWAITVVVASDWVKRDITRWYGTDPERIQVIPWGAPTTAYAEPHDYDLRRVRARLGFAGPFVLYPAMIWEHKNHLRLLQALALLRDERDLTVRLVCTGAQHEPHWSRLAAAIDELDLSDQAKFLGLVAPVELRALYRLATGVVVPTLFEAASAPMYEAWHDGAPVAASTVTSLPEQAGDAALLFDPTSVTAIADAVARLMTDPGLRRDLIAKGTKQLAIFDMDRTARAYRAVYRRVLHAELSEEDRSLLGWNWMRESQSPVP